MSARDRLPPEDEDLFDFDAVASTGAVTKPSTQSIGSPTTAPPPATAVVSALPSTKPADAPPSSITPALGRADSRPSPAGKPSAAHEGTPLRAEGASSRAEGAQVPAADAAPAPARRSKRFHLSRAAATWVAIGGLFALNAGGFWAFWRSRASFGASIEDLRATVDTATKRIEGERGAVVAPAGATLSGADPVGSMERNSLEIAAHEIKNGEFADARARLGRLLVQADRMAPGLRAEIEPRAAFLVASSYFDEARSRREPLR